MKHLRLFINWVLLLTMPVWMTIAAPFVAILVVRDEIKNSSKYPDDKDHYKTGEKWIWQ